MKLSIIIPYYETYDLTVELLKVLEPQLNRREDIVEVLLIDDGCNETRLDEFKFVKITHLDKNYGASHAWNVGLEQATGEYIGFIDSDDMVTPNYIDVLLYVINKEHTDEIQFGFNVKGSTRYGSLCPAIWKSIYKKELIIPFDESRKFHTDVPLFNHLRNTKHSKAYIKILLYYYNSNRVGSITWKRKHNIKEDKHVQI